MKKKEILVRADLESEEKALELFKDLKTLEQKYKIQYDITISIISGENDFLDKYIVSCKRSKD